MSGRKWLLTAALILTPAVTTLSYAQAFGQRVIEGKVEDGADANITGATVFLKDLKTKNVRSYTTTPDGTYRFTQVGMVDDYELWAEKAGQKSAIKTISSYDTRKQFEVELRIK